MTPLEQLLIQKIDCLRAPKEVKDAMVWALVDGKCFRGNLTHAAALAWGADDAMGWSLLVPLKLRMLAVWCTMIFPQWIMT